MANQNFRKSAFYQKNRLRAFVRDGFKCQFPYCRTTRLRSLTAHHITPACQGGTNDLDNLITLCDAHHKALHTEAIEALFFQVWQYRQAAIPARR